MPGKRLNTHSATASVRVKIENMSCNVFFKLLFQLWIFFSWGNRLGFTGSVTRSVLSDCLSAWIVEVLQGFYRICIKWRFYRGVT